MKTTLSTIDFIDAVKKAGKAVKKGVSETMDCLLLNIGERSMSVIGSNDIYSVTASIPCLSEGKYRLLVNANFLQSLLPKLPSEEVTLEKRDRLTISSGPMRFTLDPLDPEQFLKKPDVKNARLEALVSGEVLNDYVTKVIHACGREEDSPTQACVHLEMTGDKEMRVTGMCQSKIAQRGVIEGTNQVDILIKATNARDVLGLLSGDVTLKLDDHIISFEDSSTLINIGLVEEKFYNIQPMLEKKDGAIEMQVSREGLISALEASVLANPDTVEFGVTAEELSISGSNHANAFVTKLPVVATGQLTIRFNPQFVIDALRSIDDATVNFEFMSNSSAAAIIRGDEYIELICPKIA